MSATPIPRTMMMSIYGDMDLSKISEKPSIKKKLSQSANQRKKLTKFGVF